MTEKSLQEVIGVLVVIIHLVLIAILYVEFYRGGFNFPEFTTTVAIIAPMLAGYVAAIVTHFARNRFVSTDASQRVTMIFVTMSTAFPMLFFVALAASVLLYTSTRVFENFEAFKGTLTLTESVFAVYVANFVYTLFHRQDDGKKNQPESIGTGTDRADLPAGRG